MTNTLITLTAILIGGTFGNVYAQIAVNHPYDSTIHLDPDVIFTEMFEDTTSNLILGGKWSTVSLNKLNILSDPSIPANSHGSKSLRLITLDDSTNRNENTLVYKLISPGISDSIFVRYYVKYDTSTAYHHSGLWVGGKNPPSSIPGNIGGVLPLGNKEFHIGTEVNLSNGKPAVNALFRFYTYWMGMHPNKDSVYYGNDFPNSTSSDNIDLASWNCIEMMVKLNSPVTASNGELKLWINGVQITHIGYQFPNGNWSETHFTEGSGSPFGGFQWRNDEALNLNYIWLRNYNTSNGPGHIGNIYFDHLVVAKKYIGPISTKLATGINPLNTSVKISLYPNPANEIVKFSTTIKDLSVLNIHGQIVLQLQNIGSFSTEGFPEGLYIVKANNTIHKIIIKH